MASGNWDAVRLYYLFDCSFTIPYRTYWTLWCIPVFLNLNSNVEFYGRRQWNDGDIVFSSSHRPLLYRISVGGCRAEQLVYWAFVSFCYTSCCDTSPRIHTYAFILSERPRTSNPTPFSSVISLLRVSAMMCTQLPDTSSSIGETDDIPGIVAPFPQVIGISYKLLILRARELLHWTSWKFFVLFRCQPFHLHLSCHLFRLHAIPMTLTW